MITGILTAAVMITPVNLDDALLSQPETLLSDQARSVIADAGDSNLHCMDLPERSSDYARVCLTSGEWQVVLRGAERERAREDSVTARSRAIALASWYSR